MFNYIKSIFINECNDEADIYEQNEHKGKMGVEIKGEELIFKGEKESIVISIKEIKEIGDIKDIGSINNTNTDIPTVSFIANDKKYKIVGNCANKIYNRISPIINTCNNIYKTSNIRYFVYNANTKGFEEYVKDNMVGTGIEDSTRSTLATPLKLSIYEDILYYLRIEDSDSVIHFQEINTDIQYYVDRVNKCFVWSTFSGERFYTFCIRFIDESEFMEFRRIYIECCYRGNNKGEKPEDDNMAMYGSMGDYNSSNKECEYTNKKSIIEDSDTNKKTNEKSINNTVDNNKKTNKKSINNIMDNNEKSINNTNEKNINNIMNTTDADIIADLTPSSIINKSIYNTSTPTSSASNEHLVMGSDSCYISRGSSLGVFDINNDSLQFRTHIKNALNTPKKIACFGNKNNLIILDKEDQKSLSLFDLERGESIEKWSFDQSLKTGDSLNDYFSAGNSTDNNIIAISDFSLLSIDPRTKDKIASKKEYKTKNDFSCGISNQAGNIAIASRKGDLRLYDKIDKRAKTLLPGFGNEVTGIDTSSDGSIIVCTCKSYLLLYSVKNNYSKNSKDAIPVRLQLKPQHSILLNDKINFTIAKIFNYKNDSAIITSTGRLVIKWNMSDIKKGNIYNYSIKELGENVVDEDFIINGNGIVVAMKNDVKKLTEKDLKKPGF